MCSMEAISSLTIESHGVHHVLIHTDLVVLVSQVTIQCVRLAPFVTKAILIVRRGTGSVSQTCEGDVTNRVGLPILDKTFR